MLREFTVSATLRQVVLAVVVAMLVYRVVGSVITTFTYGLLERAQEDANPFLDIVVAVQNLAAIILAFIVLRWARAGHAVRLFRENERLLSRAVVISVVIAIQVVADLLLGRIEWFFYVPFSNATQIDFGLPLRLAVVGILLPGLALYLILRVSAERGVLGEDRAG
jgi:hypothetical protein